MVVQRLARFRTNLGNLHVRISQDICYVRMTDINGFLTIYGHRASLLNNKHEYKSFFNPSAETSALHMCIPRSLAACYT